jgi:predicted nucleic acid-binding Zn ribbon protein
MPSWRPFTWVILALQLPFAIWLVVVLASSDTTTCPKDEEFCHVGEAFGMAIGVVFILLIWALVDVILGVSWVVTNDNLRTCPDCGRRSKNGWLVCPGCGYEFVAAAALMKSPTKNCPECAESIPDDAKVCRYCGHDFPTKNVKCFKCNHVQAVLASQTQYTCEQCGHRLKRKTD